MASKATSENKHIDESPPFEWKAVEHGDDTLIVRDEPEKTAECFSISATSRNIRTLVLHDAVLYEGKVVEAVYDERTHTIELYHDWAGRIDRLPITDWLDHPVPLLDRLPTRNLTAETLAE